MLTNAIGIVKVVVLFTVGVQLACQSHVGELVSARRGLLVLALDAVKISVEQTGVAVVAEEYKRVCQGLEEAFDWCSDSLSLLCVVILDDGLLKSARWL